MWPLHPLLSHIYHIGGRQRRRIPLFPGPLHRLMTRLQGDVVSDSSHPLHRYTTQAMSAQAVLAKQLKALSPEQWAQALPSLCA